MAKNKPSGKDDAANSRSRASKRATSPSIDLDKSLKTLPRAHNSTLNTDGRQSNGIQKSKKQKRPMSRVQRIRQERHQSRAENLKDQMSRKIKGAKDRKTLRQARKAVWDDINIVNKRETNLLPRESMQVSGRGNSSDDQNRTDTQTTNPEEKLADHSLLSEELMFSEADGKGVVASKHMSSSTSVQIEDEEADQIT